MPFTTKDRREIMDIPDYDRPDNFMPQSGDLCYEYYKLMVESWRVKPRWTTAHEIYREMLSRTLYNTDPYDTEDDIAAYHLAWQVFFIKCVWPYELKKIEENGDI